MTGLGDDALAYAADFGWHVFPCSPANKRPLTAHGVKDASVDPEVIRQWWTKWPNAMIGVATGAVSDLVVLDLDKDAEKGLDGEASLLELLDGKRLDDTLTSRTPRGGRHLFFSAGGEEYRNTAGTLGKGIDTRGNGGYVCVPPSVNAAGKSYEWTWRPVYPAPEWLRPKPKPRTTGNGADHGVTDDDRRRAYGQAALKGEADAIAMAPEGQRNASLFKAACRLYELVLGGILTDHEATGALWSAARAAGLTDVEIGPTVDSARDRATPRGPKERTSNRNYAPQPDETEPPGAAPPQGEAPRKPQPFPFSRASNYLFAEADKEPRYLDQHRLWEIGYCHSCVGDGSVGKTRIFAQQGVAMTGNINFLGRTIEPGKFVFYSAEEREHIIYQAVDAICGAEGIDRTDLDGFHVIDRADDAAWLMVETREGTLRVTDEFRRLEDTLDVIRPLSLVIDNRARVIRGNHNDQGIAVEAIATLDRLARQFDMSVTLIGHPSSAGMVSGRGDFGSVGWSNAGRLRSYLKRADDEWQHGKPDDGKRILVPMKTSHGPLPDQISMEWRAGRWFVEPPRADDGIGRADKAERVFLKLLDRAIAEKLDPTNDAAAVKRYAPAVFFRRPDREGVNLREFEKAMAGLLERRAIEAVETRRARNRVTVLRPVRETLL